MNFIRQCHFAPTFIQSRHIPPPSFQTNVTNYVKKTPLFMECYSSIQSCVAVFILLIICNDLPVLVGVQSVEEIVTAVLPWRVRELEDRQEWKIKAVFTQWTAIRRKAFSAYNNFLLQSLTAMVLIRKTTCCSCKAGKKKTPLSCNDRTNNTFQNGLTENLKPHVDLQETLRKIPPMVSPLLLSSCLFSVEQQTLKLWASAHSTFENLPKAH